MFCHSVRPLAPSLAGPTSSHPQHALSNSGYIVASS